MLELAKDYLRINRALPIELTRAMCEFDCIVPDALPDMVRVLAVDALSVTEDASPGNGSLSVKYRIFYKILYMTDDAEAPVRSYKAVSEHTCVFDVPQIGSSCRCNAECAVEHCDHTLINSRKLALRTTVRVTPDVICSEEHAVTHALSGLERIEMKKENFTYTTSADSIVSPLTINERAELPAGKASFSNLLRSDARICDVSCQLTGDKLQIRGNLTVCTLYTADDRDQSLQIIENQFPFLHVITVDLLGDNVSWIPTYSMRLFNAETECDSDGMYRILNITATVEFRVDAYVSTVGEALIDAYAPGFMLTAENDTLEAYIGVGEISGQFVLKDVAALPENLPDIREIVNVTGSMGTVDSSCDNGKISLSGFVLCDVLYICADDSLPLSSFSVKIPFVQEIDERRAESGMYLRLSTELNHISFSMLSGRELELRIALTSRGRISRPFEITYLSAISEVTKIEIPAEQRASLILYVVQSGDTLWSIAKKYGVSCAMLAEVNQLKNPDLLMPGEKLIIVV